MKTKITGLLADMAVISLIVAMVAMFIVTLDRTAMMALRI